MVRLLILLLILSLAAIASVWFIENDGSIVVEWMGYHIQTSVAFSVLAVFIAFVLLFAFLQILILIKNAPKNYQKSAKDKKKERGLTALTEGFAAIAAGDTKQAKKLVKQANVCLGQVPATKLLAAQAAQLDGNEDEAKVHYNAMLENKETEMIAIKGLLLQAEKDEDLQKATFLAEKAVKAQPNSDWANSVLLRLYKITKKWEEAQEVLKKISRMKMLEPQKVKRDSAIISIAQSTQHKEQGDSDKALLFAQKAYKELPDFSPAAILCAKLQLDTNNKRKAVKTLESSWKQNANPQVAAAYMDIFSDETPEKRLKYADKLLNMQPNDINSHIVVAEAAIAADNASKARNHLKMALNVRETSLICKMMADVERLEEAEEESINKWLQRSQTSIAEPVWTCSKCSASQINWNSSCDNCQSFDSLKWNDNVDKMDVINPVNNALAITES